MSWRGRFAATLISLGLALVVALAQAAIAVTDKVSDVRGTKHNLSAAADGSATPSGGTVPGRTVKASSETQVCVFCHTPHEATSGVVGPLWNRALSGASYTPYNSSSMEADAAELAAQPGGSSKLCLSCHDGTMAIDKVNVLNGARNVTIPMVGSSSPVKMPSGSATTGFTRTLGTDLSSDHPISFTYNSTLAVYDGELRGPDGTVVGNRVAGGVKPKMPLENGQMQCATCHDPHLRDKVSSNGNAKFLRMNRFQVTQPSGGAFNSTNDTVCLACHDKGGVSWAYSAHANSQVASQLYKDVAAQRREFPSSLDVPANTNPPVWQVACLNCHDTHSVQGARRLLREATDSTASPKAGGNAAQEETCYQCHTTSGASAVTYVANTATAVPDIKSDFSLARHMPIKSSEQVALTEVHDVGGVFNDAVDANCSKTTGKCGKDLLESRAKLGFGGLGQLNNRHAECSDCHNPHRVVKFRDFRGNPLGAITGVPDAAGTHAHADDNAAIHSNVASGVLRGSWGVEPTYSSPSFHSQPSGFAVKRGDPGSSTAAAAGSSHVTREYQICLKCHSNYAYSDDNVYPNSSTRPQLGGTGLTPANANGHVNFSSYTNQAKEFQAPSAHAVRIGSVNLGNNGGTGTAASNNNNHRSWHPVMAPTGRTTRAGAWLAPWNNTGTGGKLGRLGVQTMYCSDCHGSSTGTTASVIPTGGDNGAAWGPHGSSINFLLKGDWSTASGEGNANTLCFKCHSASAYSGGGGTGFQTDKGDGHTVHSERIDNPMMCNSCHVAVPHGWKNRGLLVNLLDVGAEAGLAPGTAVPFTNNVGYSNGPYYRKAFLRITSFPAAGAQWTESNCNGGRDTMKTNCETPL
ncbi:cytochrome c3 family protein [Rhodoferax sp.]|uniref:cytochrome c3 family protein n=1 Tax=Rhodoferax sp. TaxID=50421 RepID=UPI002763A898|nr:cytochrome c3 family protein [Rhodoferax sp.]